MKEVLNPLQEQNELVGLPNGIELTGDYHADCDMLLAALEAVTAQRNRLSEELQFAAFQQQRHHAAYSAVLGKWEEGLEESERLRKKTSAYRAEADVWKYKHGKLAEALKSLLVWAEAPVWIDDEEGKPAFKWPAEIEQARTLLDALPQGDPNE